MAGGLNKVQIIGNLGADPEMRALPSGAGVTNFRVAVSRNRRGTHGNMVDETEWFRVVAFDSGGYKLAEICNQFLRKGQKVYVEGLCWPFTSSTGRSWHSGPLTARKPRWTE